MDQATSAILDRVFAGFEVAEGGFSRIVFPAQEKNMVYKYTLTPYALQELNALSVLKDCSQVVKVIGDPARMLLEGVDMVRFAMPRMSGDLTGLVQGRALSERIRDRVAKQLIAGMYEMHTRQVVHLDLKLDNVLYAAFVDTATGELADVRVAYADFGLSAVNVPYDSLFEGVRGSGAYVPPEMWEEDRKWNPYAADVYSFGIMIYALYYASFPFHTSEKKNQHFTEFQLAQAWQHKTPTDALDALWPCHSLSTAPESRREIFDRCLQIDPSKRFRFFDRD